MCTIKKDNDIVADSTWLVDDLAVPSPTPSSFFDMSLKDSNFRMKNIQTKMAAASSTNDDPNYHKILEELKKLGFVLENIQRSLDEVPIRVVNAIITNFNRDSTNKRKVEQDEEFDKFSEISSSSIQSHGSAYSALSADDLTDDGSSVYRYPGSIAESTESIIAAEITKLSDRLLKNQKSNNYDSSSSVSSIKPPPKVQSSPKNLIYSHWAERFEASKLEQSQPNLLPIALTCDKYNNNNCSKNNNSSTSGSIHKFPLFEIPKILPYNSAIDQNIWLK